MNSIPPGRIMSEQILRNYPPDYRKQFAETEIPVRYWGEPARGGHFAAFEQPELFVDEVRAFFALVR